MNYLFIGGPKDGERINIDRPQYVMYFYEYKIGEKIRYFETIQPEAVAANKFKVVEYRQMRLKGEKEVFTIFVLDGLTADDVFHKLLENYVYNK
jgi:hypothetical protein